MRRAKRALSRSPPKSRSAAVAYGDRTPRPVLRIDSRVHLEHAGNGAVLEELRGHGIVIDALAPPGHLAKEEPFVEPIVNVVTLGEPSAVAGQFQRRRRAVRYSSSKFWRMLRALGFSSSVA